MRVCQVEVDVLFLIRGRVLVGHEREIGENAGSQTSKLQVEVEPPAWVLLSEYDQKQNGQHENSCGRPEGKLTVVRPGAGVSATDGSQHNGDGDGVDDPKEG